MSKRRKKLLLIDGSHALFRAFHAIRNLRAPDGTPSNAVFGWVKMLLKLIDTHKPDYVAACFDASSRSFRVEIDPNYKANRSETPPELLVQWPVALRITSELGVLMLDDDRLEADDIIATLATTAHGEGVDVLISSGDKDLMALVTDGDGGAQVRQINEKKGKSTVYDEAGVVDKWGVGPKLIEDLLALMGDSVDNVPGVRGIGQKGAVKLLHQWGSFEGVYANLDDVQTARTQQLLRDSEQDARRSRELVTLVRDAPLGLTLQDLAPTEPDKEALTESFRALGFKRLMRTYFADRQQTLIETARVTDAAQLSEVIAKLRDDATVGLDVVTSLRDEQRHLPMQGELIGLALSGMTAGTYYIPVDRGEPGTTADLFAPVAHHGIAVSRFRQIVGPLLADPSIKKVGHDLKHALIVLRREALPVAGLSFDTLLAGYLLSAGRSRPGLGYLALELLNCQMASYEATFGAGRNKIEPLDAAPEAISRWLGERAAVAVRIEAKMRAQLAEAHLSELHDQMELPLTVILADVEHRGVLLDTGELAAQSEALGKRCDELQRTIWQHAGGVFNIGSPKQLGEVLFDTLGLPTGKKTKTGYSTNQATLDGLRDKHPIIEEVFAWRQLSKLKSTYTDALPALVNAQTGRVHTSFNQAVAATGRLSSVDPNLQNIPIRTTEGKKIRQAFIARPGHVLLSADYSQIELRVMAHLANEPTMQAAFRDGVDVHKQTAAAIFHVPLDEVTSEQRSAAKTINFGILYGMGATRLAAAIHVSRKEAKVFIQQYFERFAKVKDWVDGTLEHAREHCEVRTMFGRRRVIDEIISSNHMVKAGAERIAVNTPVQGSAADIIKKAMILVQERLDAADSKAVLLLQVHDELLLEVPQAEADDITKLVCDAMADAVQLNVPLRVDARYGKDWADAH